MALTVIGSGGGIPVGVPTIETGSYVGSGTGGSTGPTVITFTKTPKYVVIIDSYANYMSRIAWLNPSVGGRSSHYNSFSELFCSLDGNTLSFYNNSGSNVNNKVDYGMNKATTTYYYFAITI